MTAAIQLLHDLVRSDLESRIRMAKSWGLSEDVVARAARRWADERFPIKPKRKR